MIRSVVLTKDHELRTNTSLSEISNLQVQWYWIDFHCPTEEEGELLNSFFHFHPLAIEDCFHFLQRPKLDYYNEYHFLVLHSLVLEDLESRELDLFVGKNYIVSFHLSPLPEIEEVWKRILHNHSIWKKGHIYITYALLDKLVDQYFPAIYKIEDEITVLDKGTQGHSIPHLIDKIFELRGDLLKLRRVVTQMRDLLYRILNSTHLEDFHGKKMYFTDIYDHLLKLSEMIESNRDITSDMRDSYLSMISYRMNIIMTLLTVITTIFVPLTFIVGIYGMNFKNMPELEWKYGYFIILFIMITIALFMTLWFKKKGWFHFYRQDS